MTTKHVPIFEKDGNLFFSSHPDWIADNDEDAHAIGWGVQIVEGAIYGFKFKEVRVLDSENIPHVKANLGNGQVLLIEGPLFDEVNNEHKEQSNKPDQPHSD